MDAEGRGLMTNDSMTNDWAHLSFLPEVPSRSCDASSQKGKIPTCRDAGSRPPPSGPARDEASRPRFCDGASQPRHPRPLRLSVPETERRPMRQAGCLMK